MGAALRKHARSVVYNFGTIFGRGGLGLQDDMVSPATDFVRGRSASRFEMRAALWRQLLTSLSFFPS